MSFQSIAIMGLRSYLVSLREKKAATKAAKQVRNDKQRQTESLLRIAMKKHSSLNSLTPRDPAQAHLEKQARLRAEAEAAAAVKAEPEKIDVRKESMLVRQDSVAGGQMAIDRSSLGEENFNAIYQRRAMAEMGTASCLDGKAGR